MITQDELKDILHYNPDSGDFTWLVGHSSVGAGDVAGHRHTHGYMSIEIGEERWRAHRLAFFYMEGYCPEFVDHINGIKDDNRWSNLRPATHAQNMRNRRSQKGSSSKFLGVSKHTASGKWQAYIRVNGKNTNLGYFKKEEDAAKAYDAAASKHFKEFANLNFKDVEVVS